MAQSRCSFSILIRYGSLKVSSINAFLDCWNRSGMIVAEELLSREWKCHGFSHLARRKREETRIFLPSPGGPDQSLAQHGDARLRPKTSICQFV